MRVALVLLSALLFVVGVAGADAQTGGDQGASLAAATADIARELQKRAACDLGGSTKVGIWPLNTDKLPMAPESAAQVYGAILADLIADKPDCVGFFDGAGAGATLEYLNKTGALALPGDSSREQINAAFRDVAYIVSITIYDQGGAILGALKLAEPNGQTIAAPPAFPIPEAYLSQSCGMGAVPLDTALQRAAKVLVEAAPDMRQLVNEGGFYADTSKQTSFSDFAGQMFVGLLVRTYANPITGKQLLVAEQAQPNSAGTYRLRFRYWPCEDGDRLVMSAQLSGDAGATASWNGAVLAAGLPQGIELVPVPDKPEIWSLSVTPSRASVGDEIAVVAEVPARCSAVFVDFGPSGKATVIPLQFFVTEQGDEGGRRFRADASTQYGLTILPEDEKGWHLLGFFCGAAGETGSVDVLRAVWEELAAGSGRQIEIEAPRNYWFERYEVR